MSSPTPGPNACLYFSQFGILPTNAVNGWSTTNGFNGRIHAVICNSGTDPGEATVTFSSSWFGTSSHDTGVVTPGNCVTIDESISLPPLQFPSNVPPWQNPQPTNLPPGCGPLQCTASVSCLNVCTGMCATTVTATLSGQYAGSKGCDKYGFPSGDGASVSVTFSAYIDACQEPTQLSGGGSIPSPPPSQGQQQGGSYTPPGAQPTKTQPTVSNVPSSAPSQPNQPVIYATVFAIPDISYIESTPNAQLSDPGSIVTLINKVKEHARAYDKEYADDLAELAQYIEQIRSSGMVAMQAESIPPFPANLAHRKFIKTYKLQPEQPISDVIEVPPAPKVGSHIGALVVIYFIPNTLTSTGAVGMDVKGYVVPLATTATNTTSSGGTITTFSYETVFVPQLGITITGTSTASGVPGQTLSLQYVVTNQSNVPVTITLQVTDNYGTSITQTQSAPECSASPCPSVTFNVQYTIPFSAQPNTSYTVTATATATYQNASTQPVSTTTTINVLSQQQVALTTLSVVPSQTLICATPGSSVTIGATVTNSSNIQQQVTVELLSQDGSVVNSQQLTVPAQGSAQVSFNLIAPQQLGYYFYQIAVAVDSQVVNSSYVAVDVSATCTAATVAPAATPTTAPTPATAQIQQVMQVMLVMMMLNIFTMLTTALIS